MKSTRQVPYLSRRSLLLRLATVAGAAVVWRSNTRAQTGTPMVVYKDPGCDCCEAWIKYMKANGFTATVTNTTDVNAIKRQRKIAEKLWSCHTAIVGAYVIEGHVPAGDVRKLLSKKTKGIVGLTIPGMPQSAPGMDTKPFQPYTVLTFDGKGDTAVFTEHVTG